MEEFTSGDMVPATRSTEEQKKSFSAYLGTDLSTKRKTTPTKSWKPYFGNQVGCDSPSELRKGLLTIISWKHTTSRYECTGNSPRTYPEIYYRDQQKHMEGFAQQGAYYCEHVARFHEVTQREPRRY